MWLQTVLLLVLVSMVTARADGVSNKDADHVDILESLGYPDGLATYRSNSAIHRREQGRHKRAVKSFLRDWLRLIRTTTWGGWLQFNGASAKVFLKVGDKDDALKDFYSLKPKTVTKDSEGLQGTVGDQVFWVDIQPNFRRIYVQGSDRKVNRNKIPRIILYYDTTEELIKHLDARTF